MNARQQYLEELGKEYSRADEKGRGRLLDEAEKRTGPRNLAGPGFQPAGFLGRDSEVPPRVCGWNRMQV